MGPISFPEKSLKDYHSTLRYTAEEGSSHQHRGGSLKARTDSFIIYTTGVTRKVTKRFWETEVSKVWL
jgi:hypothetical protein